MAISTFRELYSEVTLDQETGEVHFPTRHSQINVVVAEWDDNIDKSPANRKYTDVPIMIVEQKSGNNIATHAWMNVEQLEDLITVLQYRVKQWRDTEPK